MKKRSLDRLRPTSGQLAERIVTRFAMSPCISTWTSRAHQHTGVPITWRRMAASVWTRTNAVTKLAPLSTSKPAGETATKKVTILCNGRRASYVDVCHFFKCMQ